MKIIRIMDHFVGGYRHYSNVKELKDEIDKGHLVSGNGEVVLTWNFYVDDGIEVIEIKNKKDMIRELNYASQVG